VLTRTRLAGLVIALVAAGSLAAGLATVLHDRPAGPTAAGLVAHPVTSSTSPGSPGSDNADAKPAATSAAHRLLRPTVRGNTSTDQPSTEPARPASASAPGPTATSSGPSYYTIHNQAHDLCLNAMNHVNASQVDVADCNGSWYQEWTGLKDGSAEEVVNKESGLCLAAKSVANGADVDIATCQGGRGQLWLPDGARLYLAAASSGLCLAGDSAATNESPAGAATCTSGTNQKWSW
jgi:hypothetical protein